MNNIIFAVYLIRILFIIAYWPRTDNPNAAAAANAANMFASTAGGYGLGAHPSLPFGLLPTTTGRGMSPYPTSTTAAAAYNNAYTNTLSVAASQAASLGIPAASKYTINSLQIAQYTIIV